METTCASPALPSRLFGSLGAGLAVTLGSLGSVWEDILRKPPALHKMYENLCKTQVLKGLGIQVRGFLTPRSQTKRVRIAKLPAAKENLSVNVENLC